MGHLSPRALIWFELRLGPASLVQLGLSPLLARGLQREVNALGRQIDLIVSVAANAYLGARSRAIYQIL